MKTIHKEKIECARKKIKAFTETVIETPVVLGVVGLCLWIQEEINQAIKDITRKKDSKEYKHLAKESRDSLRMLGTYFIGVVSLISIMAFIIGVVSDDGQLFINGIHVLRDFMKLWIIIFAPVGIIFIVMGCYYIRKSHDDENDKK